MDSMNVSKKLIKTENKKKDVVKLARQQLMEFINKQIPIKDSLFSIVVKKFNNDQYELEFLICYMDKDNVKLTVKNKTDYKYNSQEMNYKEACDIICDNVCDFFSSNLDIIDYVSFSDVNECSFTMFIISATDNSIIQYVLVKDYNEPDKIKIKQTSDSSYDIVVDKKEYRINVNNDSLTFNKKDKNIVNTMIHNLNMCHIDV